MAEVEIQDVVNQTLSAGDLSLSDAPAITTGDTVTGGDERDGLLSKENGIYTEPRSSSQMDDQLLEDGAAKSDTDTSRAEGSIAEDGKSSDSKPVKKFIASKPVSFAKYSVPKVIAANASKSTVDKAAVSNTLVSTPQPIGRPRLVAKTTSAVQQKAKPFKAATPDPMQVWNKNRVTPQPSTKHLTDEELKQQYGIHLTTRLQSDGVEKEAKWADIDDDDEDDWAPETIEWGDGTKTTVNPADTTPATKSSITSKPSTPADDTSRATPDSKPVTTFTTSIGPNATVLKIGANAERQQAQKAAQLPRGPIEKPPMLSSQTTPAPPPTKSPWAKLPPVDKTSPVEIAPQLSMGPPPPRYYPNGQHQSSSSFSGPSAAKEISADDFNRGWRESPSNQPRELFMPSSGRYEAVPEHRRRMSRNDQGFRAPAVLQRPGVTDPRAPEPSPAFQTNRTSSDAARRRASSTVSGGSGQMARRMSIKSVESPFSGIEGTMGDLSVATPSSREGSLAHVETPVFQAHGSDYPMGTEMAAGPTDAEIEAQRAQQKALMRERIEQARKRKIEEEARLEAEKQERIRQKLASLGPDPKLTKSQGNENAKTSEGMEYQGIADSRQALEAGTNAQNVSASATQTSPPKPPQPLATGEPQQYGMMKVHPMDTVKKISPPAPHQPQPVRPLTNVQNLQPTVEDATQTASHSGSRVALDSQRPQTDASSVLEPMSRNRPVSAVAEARASWGRNDHRSPPTGSLWGLPNNKALGNGTFDSSLAGYAPQDLSSRASSTGQGWMNGKTPTVGQSPQLHHINQHVPETRSQTLQSMTSPEPQPLTVNSEIDSMLPVRPPAPIGPPHAQQPTQPTLHGQQGANGYPQNQNNAAVTSWNNFHNVARVQERADAERFQREVAERKEEEKRTGVRQQANYNFNETFKQVQLGENPAQRQVNNVAQSNLPSSKLFGAVGSLPPSALGTQTSRGSRFFPQQDRRAVTYSYPETPRSPSPPPAEEDSSLHPAYDHFAQGPIVRLPPEKAVVKLPPAKPPTPTSPVELDASPVAATPQQPMTWAARVSMPSKAATPLRAASTPIVQNPSWQERFNGLLGKNQQTSQRNDRQVSGMQSSHPVLAIAAASREPLDVIASSNTASVSLPDGEVETVENEEVFLSKDVEEEEDLFEDREAGSLPTIELPRDAPVIQWPRPMPPRVMPTPPNPQSAFIFLGSHWKEDKYPKQHFAIVRVPGNEKSVKKDLPIKTQGVMNSSRPQSRNPSGGVFKRGQKGLKPRPATTPVKNQ